MVSIGSFIVVLVVTAKVFVTNKNIMDSMLTKDVVSLPSTSCATEGMFVIAGGVVSNRVNGALEKPVISRNTILDLATNAFMPMVIIALISMIHVATIVPTATHDNLVDPFDSTCICCTTIDAAGR